MQRSDDVTTVSDEIGADERESSGSTTASTKAAEHAPAAGDDTETRQFGDFFSLKAVLFSMVLIAVGVVVGGAVPLVGAIGSLAGVFVATFLVGLVVSQRRYLETAVAGGGVVGASFAASLLTTGALPVGWHFFQQYGLAFAGLGVGLGAILAVVGHYFGRDLRDGLTQDL